MTRATIGQPGREQVDISKEERLEKCNTCYSIFINIEGATRTMARHDGRIGSFAQELLRGFENSKLFS